MMIYLKWKKIPHFMDGTHACAHDTHTHTHTQMFRPIVWKVHDTLIQSVTDQNLLEGKKAPKEDRVAQKLAANRVSERLGRTDE